MDDLDHQPDRAACAATRARPWPRSPNSCGVARGTVQNRIARLERDGTIAGYTVRLKPQPDVHRHHAR